VKSLVVAKIDGSANDVHHVVGKGVVTGFPTLILFPFDDKSRPGKLYTGDRTLKAMAEFLAKESSTKFEIPKALKDKFDDEKDDDDEEEEDEHAGHDHDHDEL